MIIFKAHSKVLCTYAWKSQIRSRRYFFRIQFICRIFFLMKNLEIEKLRTLLLYQFFRFLTFLLLRSIRQINWKWFSCSNSALVLRFMTLNSSAMVIKILLLHPIIMYLTNIYQILAIMGFFPLFPLRLYYWNHLSRKCETERYISSFFMDKKWRLIEHWILNN